MMKKALLLSFCALILSASSGAVMAQDYDYHPALSDNFTISLGWFRSDNAFKISAENLVDDAIPNDEIDFPDSVGVDDTSTLFNGQFRWKFGRERKWSLMAQYFESNATGEAVLTEDVEWQNLIFREGTFVGAGVKVAVSRLFVGRSFVKKPQHDFGLGLGLHILDVSAFIEGEININDETTGFQRGDADASQPLPNIGGWWNFSPARRWLIHTRVDWISANVDKYDGTLWNAEVGVNFQAWRHVGLGLAYQYFDLDFSVDDKDWIGSINLRYSGPVLALTFNW